MITASSNPPTFTAVGLLFLRVFLGMAMFLGHGLGKWEKLFAGGDIQFADPFGIGALPSLAMAVFAEVICAILLVFGLLTRAVLIPLIVIMLVAIFAVHSSDGFGGMEKALLYGAGFLTLMLTGPGTYSMDGFLRTRKQNVTK